MVVSGWMRVMTESSEVGKAIVEAGEGEHRLLERRDPAKAARILEKLAEGLSIRRIMEEEGVAFHTVVGVRTRHAKLIAGRREVVAQDALELVEGARLLQKQKMEMLADNPAALGRMNLRDLAISYGVYADKFFMATEGNKVVVEHRTGAPSLEDAMKAIEEAKAKLKAGAVDVDVLTKPVEKAE